MKYKTSIAIKYSTLDFFIGEWAANILTDCGIKHDTHVKSFIFTEDRIHVKGLLRPIPLELNRIEWSSDTTGYFKADNSNKQMKLVVNDEYHAELSFPLESGKQRTYSIIRMTPYKGRTLSDTIMEAL